MHLAQSHNLRAFTLFQTWSLEPFEHDFWLPTDTLGTIWTNMVHLQLIQVESNIANVV